MEELAGPGSESSAAVVSDIVGSANSVGVVGLVSVIWAEAMALCHRWVDSWMLLNKAANSSSKPAVLEMYFTEAEDSVPYATHMVNDKVHDKSHTFF